MHPKISVIMAVYNSEAYLREALDSVLTQSISSLEVICINDGSPDNSAEILDEYARSDSRIHVITQKNAGASAARNAGLNIAQGQYIHILDGDDMVPPGAYERMYTLAVENNLDVLFFDAQVVFTPPDLCVKFTDLQDWYHRKHTYPHVTNGPELFLQMLNHGDYRTQASMFLYKRSFADQKKLRFYEGITHEDHLFTFLCTVQAANVMHVHEDLFIRRIRQASTMTGAVTLHNVQGLLTCYLEIQRYMSDHFLPGAVRTAIETELQKIAKGARWKFGSLSDSERAKISSLPMSMVQLLQPECTKGKNASRDAELFPQSSYQDQINQIRYSFAYRIGFAALYPVRYLKHYVTLRKMYNHQTAKRLLHQKDALHLQRGNPADTLKAYQGCSSYRIGKIISVPLLPEYYLCRYLNRSSQKEKLKRFEQGMTTTYQKLQSMQHSLQVCQYKLEMNEKISQQHQESVKTVKDSIADQLGQILSEISNKSQAIPEDIKNVENNLVHAMDTLAAALTAQWQNTEQRFTATTSDLQSKIQENRELLQHLRQQFEISIADHQEAENRLFQEAQGIKPRLQENRELLRHLRQQLETSIADHQEAENRLFQEAQGIKPQLQENGELLRHLRQQLEDSIADYKEAENRLFQEAQGIKPQLQENREAMQNIAQQFSTPLEQKMSALHGELNVLHKDKMRTMNELLWADIFHDTIRQSRWLEQQTFSPGRWAAGYPLLYVLYRCLDQAMPKNILELGLGQSTNIISQYACSHADIFHLVIEQNEAWVQFFKARSDICDKTRIRVLPCTMAPFMEASEVRVYQGFSEAVANRKYDLIFIDAPSAEGMDQYSRIDVLQLIPKYLSDQFIIILDDYQRNGERQTGRQIDEAFQSAGIEFVSKIYGGQKDSRLWCSPDLKFLGSL